MAFETSTRFVIKSKDKYICWNSMANWIDKTDVIWNAIFFKDKEEAKAYLKKYHISYTTLQQISLHLVGE